MGYNITEQLELEREMLDAGISRFRSEMGAALSSSRESHSQHGRAVVSRVVGEVSKGVAEFQALDTNHRNIAHQKLKDMNPDKVAYLALVSMVDGLSKSNPLLKVGSSIGSNVEMQDRLDKWVSDTGEVARNTIKKANEKGSTARRFGLTNKMNKDGYDYLKWTKEERAHVGLRLVDIIISKTAIVKLERLHTGRKKTTTYLRATETTEDWVKAFNKHMEVMRPRWTPCIIPPKEWTDIYGGGYYADFLEDLPIIRRG